MNESHAEFMQPTIKHLSLPHGSTESTVGQVKEEPGAMCLLFIMGIESHLCDFVRFYQSPYRQLCASEFFASRAIDIRATTVVSDYCAISAVSIPDWGETIE